MTDYIVYMLIGSNVLIAVLAFFAGRGDIPRFWRRRIVRLDKDMDKVYAALEVHRLDIDALKAQLSGLSDTDARPGRHSHTGQIPRVDAGNSVQVGAAAPQ